MDSLLQESGFHLLQEDGSFILLETQGGSGPSPYQEFVGVYTMLPKNVRGIKV